MNIIKKILLKSKDTEFYSKFDFNNLETYTIINRKELQNSREKFLTKDALYLYKSNQLIVQKSSGSTGEPLSVYWKKNELFFSNLILWRKRNEWYNIKANDRVVKFTSIKYNSNYEMSNNELNINYFYLRNENNFLNILKVINDFKPIWLYVQPTILKDLMYYYSYNKNLIPKSLIYIETYGEIRLSHLKEDIENLFHVKTANMYGSEEMNAIAYECPFGKLHILEDNVYVECLNNEGKIVKNGQGISIITSLQNYSMPLIRYNQGDYIEIVDNKEVCQCGLFNHYISKVFGRSFEFIESKDFIIRPLDLLYLISKINSEYENCILKFHFFFFKKENNLICKIKLNNRYLSWFNEVSSSLKNYLNKLFMLKINVEIEKLDDDLLIKKNNYITIKGCN